MSAKHSPLPWKVRKHPDLGCFIEARIPGKPYGQEIMGDDYFPELSREADAEFIVQCVEVAMKAKAFAAAYQVKSGDEVAAGDAQNAAMSDLITAAKQLL